MTELAIQQPALIGRDAELARLKQSLANATAGKGSTVFIAGEAGIGKTRLVSELIAEAEKKGAQIIRGWCLAESLEPLMPVKSALREAGLFHLISGDPPPLVVSAYLMNDAGLLISKSEREELGLEPYTFSAMLTGVGNFVKDSMRKVDNVDRTGGLNILGFQDYKILIEESGGLHLACVTKGSLSELLVKDMREILSEVQKSYGALLSDWDGDVAKVKDTVGIVSRLFQGSKYSGRFVIDDAQQRQEHTIDNILLGAQRLSADKPVLLFLDDLQWADPSTLNLCHYIARNTKDDRVMIIGTYRSEEIVQSEDGKPHHLTDAMQKMNREDLLTIIDLRRLDSDKTKEIIDSCLGKTSFDGNLLERIYQETEGNPFFVLEVIKLLAEDGAIKQDKEGIWKLQTEIKNLDLPSKVYDVVRRRLDRLMEEQKELLECASVIGEEFSTDILEKTIDVKKMTLLKNLSKIEKTHNLIHYLKDKYRFDHAKVREVLYNGIGEELRREYHKIIADTLCEIHKDDLDAVVSELAYHFYEAGDERAGPYIMRSGDLRWSKRVDEIKKVVKREDYLKEVLEKKVGVYYLPKDYSISKFVHEIENAGLARKDIKRYFRVIVYPDFGPIVEIVGVTPNFNEIVTNSVFNKNNEYAGYSYVLSKDTLEKIEEDEINKSSDEVLNDWLILCKKAYEKSQNEDNWMSSAYGLMEIGMVYYFQNRLDEALKSYEKALKLSEEIANQVPDLNDMFIDNICGLAEVQSALGNHANAFINAKKAVDLAEEKGENHEKGNSQRTLGVVHRGMKEWEKAKEKLDKASEFFKDAGQFQQTRITYEYGLLCKAMGDMKIAEKYLEKAQSKFEWMGMRVWADKCRKDLEELRQ